MKKALISACLIGRPVRYDGRIRCHIDPVLLCWHQQGLLVSFCPEVAGGLPVPRCPAEIQGGQALKVLREAARIFTRDGQDVTQAFAAGAQMALDRCRAEGIRQAILKDGSPSCGSTYIYDGTFCGCRVPGMGLTAAVLQSAGIHVVNEHNLAKVLGATKKARQAF
jgi:uncharacterized protein YbbK (DUF523 family)